MVGGYCKRCGKYDAFINFSPYAKKYGYEKAKKKVETLLKKQKCTCGCMVVDVKV